MKIKYLLYTVSLFLGLASSACYLDDDFTPSDNLIKVEMEFPIIKGIELEMAADVYLRQGPIQKIVIEAKESLIDHFSTYVENDVWNIDLHNHPIHGEVNIFITLPDINYIKSKGSGDIYSTKTFTNQNEITIRAIGSGDIQLDAEANVIRTRILGSGDVSIWGTAIQQDILISGSGKLEALGLYTVETYINSSGSGDAYINISDELTGEISGSSNVYYIGDPTIDIGTHGTGELLKYK